MPIIFFWKRYLRQQIQLRYPGVNIKWKFGEPILSVPEKLHEKINEIIDFTVAEAAELGTQLEFYPDRAYYLEEK